MFHKRIFKHIYWSHLKYLGLLISQLQFYIKANINSGSVKIFDKQIMFLILTVYVKEKIQ